MELVRLHRDVKGSTKYLEGAIARIAAMSERLGGDALWLTQTVWSLYASRSPFLGLWIALDVADVIIGHLVVSVQQWDNENVGWIHQAEYDGPRLDHIWWERCVEEITLWARNANTALPAGSSPMRRLMLSTPHDPKFFERRGGFRLYRSLMDRMI